MQSLFDNKISVSKFHCVSAGVLISSQGDCRVECILFCLLFFIYL